MTLRFSKGMCRGQTVGSEIRPYSGCTVGVWGGIPDPCQGQVLDATKTRWGASPTLQEEGQPPPAGVGGDLLKAPTGFDFFCKGG